LTIPLFFPVSLKFGAKLLISETGNEMVIDNANGLEMGINDRRTYESEASLNQILADSIRERSPGGYLREFFPAVDDGFIIHETPDISIETAELFLNGKKTFGVIDGRLNLSPIPYDSGIG
jgi:hypothetical protein